MASNDEYRNRNRLFAFARSYTEEPALCQNTQGREHTTTHMQSTTLQIYEYSLFIQKIV